MQSETLTEPPASTLSLYLSISLSNPFYPMCFSRPVGKVTAQIISAFTHLTLFSLSCLEFFIDIIINYPAMLNIISSCSHWRVRLASAFSLGLAPTQHHTPRVNPHVVPQHVPVCVFWLCVAHRDSLTSFKHLSCFLARSSSILFPLEMQLTFLSFFPFEQWINYQRNNKQCLLHWKCWCFCLVHMHVWLGFWEYCMNWEAICSPENHVVHLWAGRVSV